MTARKLRLDHALLPGGWKADVTVSVDGSGIIDDVRIGGEPNDASRVRGIAVPGLANVHSHAHQRAMVGLAERSGPGDDSFWTWREAMYGFALRIEPEDLQAIAAQLYVETLKAGFTSVGEFQYLHHGRDGTPYGERAEMTLRCLEAANEAGIAITLLPTLYSSGGFGGLPPAAGQRRFVNDVDGFSAIVSTLDRAVRDNPLAKLGIAPHSLRAVPADGIRHAVGALDELRRDAPVHIHVAEQTKEVEDCLAFSGQRPVELLMSSEQLSPRWCLIHATHMTDGETRNLAASGAIAGLCPTTEANLGDGTFNARAYLEHDGAIAIGSDSHATVSVSEDLRQLEYSQRLLHRRRNVLAGSPDTSTGRRLFTAALGGGARAIAQPAAGLDKGQRADIVVLDDAHPSLIGRRGDAVLDTWIFSGGNACVKDVFVAGRQVVSNRAHEKEDAIKRRFESALARLKE